MAPLNTMAFGHHDVIHEWIDSLLKDPLVIMMHQCSVGELFAVTVLLHHDDR